MGSHYCRANYGIMQARDLGANEEYRFCVAMPIFHCFCLSVNVMASCAVGACLCSIYEGSSQVQQIVISGQMLK